MRALLVAAAIWSAAGPGLATAQDTAETAEDAGAHFDRGMSFYAEGRFDAALAEFERAYALAPAYQTLYNLAQVYAALGRSVEAAGAFERYLRDAPATLPARRRRAVQSALAEQQARIGTLLVEIDGPRATLSIDGIDVATIPMEAPLPLSAGLHRVVIRAPGYEASRHAVTLAGRERRRLRVTLRPEVVERGQLRITSSVPGVTVIVDGAPVGTTPLDSTVPVEAGEHLLEARRPAYRTLRRPVRVEEGADVDVQLELEPLANPDARDLGELMLLLPPTPALIRIDGDLVSGRELTLPAGAHRLAIEMAERRPYDGAVRVVAGEDTEVTPALRWTLDARQARLDGAGRQRSWGQGLVVSGTIVALSAMGVFTWNELEISETDRERREVQAAFDRMGCNANPSAACQDLEEQGGALNQRADEQDVLRYATLGGLGLGAVLVLLGAVLWSGAPSEEQVDESAHARLEIGIGQVRVVGGF